MTPQAPRFLEHLLGLIARPVSQEKGDAPDLAHLGGMSAPKTTTATTVVFCFTGLVTLLYLCLPIFSLQLFTTLIPAGNFAALASLTVVVGIFVGCQCGLDFLRAVVLSRLGSRIMLCAFDLALRSADLDERLRLTRDGERVCDFLSGRLSRAVFDVFWSCIFVIGMFWLHEVLGWVTVFAIACIYSSWLLSEVGARRVSRRAFALAASSTKLINSWELTSEYAAVTGLWHQTWSRYARQRAQGQLLTAKSQMFLSGFECGREGLRLLLQIMLMFFTGMLVMRHSLSVGVVVSCNILFARALAAHEQAVNHLSSVRTAAQSYMRIVAWAPKIPVGVSGSRITLVDPRCTIIASTMCVVGPHEEVILENVDISVRGGEIVVVVGGEGSGKTTVLNALSGLVRLSSGTLTWNGFPLEQIDADERAERLGLLLENPSLGEGDICQIVSSHRFADFSHVVDATILAGCDKDIQRLPAGYRTEVPSHRLSAGLTTKLALARAFYNAPRFLCLDSPTRALSLASERIVASSLVALRNRGCAILVATHSAAIMRIADRTYEMNGGVAINCLTPSEIAEALAGAAPSMQRRAL